MITLVALSSASCAISVVAVLNMMWGRFDESDDSVDNDSGLGTGLAVLIWPWEGFEKPVDSLDGKPVDISVDGSEEEEDKMCTIWFIDTVFGEIGRKEWRECEWRRGVIKPQDMVV